MPTAPEADELLAQRYPADQAGRALIAIRDAALPLTALNVTVLAQERKRLPLLDEFVLRLTNMGVDSAEQIGGLLGLPDLLVAQAIAAQFSEDTLRYAHTGTPKTLQLTPKGREAATELASIRPVRTTLDFYFDRVAWALHPCNERELISRHQADDEGMIILPFEKSRVIGDSDLTPSTINTFVAETDSTVDELVEVVNVRKYTEKPTTRFRHVKLLVFADVSRKDISLGVVIDDERSPDHELALARLGGADGLGIQIEQPAERPRLDEDLERLRLPTQHSSTSEVPAAEPADKSALPEEANDVLSASVDQTPAIEVRGIGVFEHPVLLNTALTTAKDRLLIISPWLRSEVITTDFIGKLEGRLRRGVRVHIAHGYEDHQPNPRALQRLENLARRYPERFAFTRIQNTHAKILIFDDVWISTSFNWLSFRGDPNRTYRMEEGTLVRDATTVTARYEQFVQRITDEAVS